MRIIHIAAEIAPIAKVGGLADVLYGLSRAQTYQGEDVTVIIPKYDLIDIPLTRLTTFNSYFDGKKCKNTLWQGNLDGIKLLLIEAHHKRKWFNRKSIYVSEDDDERFLYFCKAVFDYLQSTKLPDILHLHDWQTTALSYLFKTETTPTPKIITTIHNMLHQGKCNQSLLKALGLKKDIKLLDDVKPRKINLLKTGIIYSDCVNTVSPTYAKEVMTSKFGCGLEKTLRKYKTKFSGILNGIDFNYWNPDIDPLIGHCFSANNLAPRHLNKSLIRKELSLEDTPRPLVGVITRLVPQKGVDLIIQAMKQITDLGGQLVLLGSSPFPTIEKKFKNFEKKYRNDPNIRLILGYNEKLAHQIYAGSDMFLVPSLFEPCGLTQLIALRYGSIPIVRHTGGLADTVENGVNGFSFKKPTPEAFIATLKRAFSLWHNSKKEWQRMQRIGMRQDFSWQTASKHYLDMYQSM